MTCQLVKIDMFPSTIFLEPRETHTIGYGIHQKQKFGKVVCEWDFPPVIFTANNAVTLNPLKNAIPNLLK